METGQDQKEIKKGQLETEGRKPPNYSTLEAKRGKKKFQRTEKKKCFKQQKVINGGKRENN